jgi:hypothetical protein
LEQLKPRNLKLPGVFWKAFTRTRSRNAPGPRLGTRRGPDWERATTERASEIHSDFSASATPSSTSLVTEGNVTDGTVSRACKSKTRFETRSSWSVLREYFIQQNTCGPVHRESTYIRVYCIPPYHVSVYRYACWTKILVLRRAANTSYSEYVGPTVLMSKI